MKVNERNKMKQKIANELNNQRIIKNYKRLIVRYFHYNKISITNLLCNQLPMILMFG